MSVRTGRWEWGQYAHRSSAGSPTADIQGRRQCEEDIARERRQREEVGAERRQREENITRK